MRTFVQVPQLVLLFDVSLNALRHEKYIVNEKQYIPRHFNTADKRY